MSLASLACVSFTSGASVSRRPHITSPALLAGRVSLLWAILLCCLFALAQPVHARVIFTSDVTINYAINATVYVEGSPTVALVSGGSIAGDLFAFDGSTVNVSGGSVGLDLGASNASTVNMSGGSVGAFLIATDTGTINLSGGSVGIDLVAQDSSTANVSGGSIAGALDVYGSSTINVYGTGLRLTGPFSNGYLTYYTLSGTLADGTAINNPVYLFSGVQISQVVLHNTDPFVALKAQVQALSDAGVLNKGNTNALLVKLNAAQSALAAGDTAGARDSLIAFVNQVNAFARTGKLSSSQAAALTSAAQSILNSLP